MPKYFPSPDDVFYVREKPQVRVKAKMVIGDKVTTNEEMFYPPKYINHFFLCLAAADDIVVGFELFNGTGSVIVPKKIFTGLEYDFFPADPAIIAALPINLIAARKENEKIIKPYFEAVEETYLSHLREGKT